MTESAKPQSASPKIPEDFYWVTYLREDIQDLRQDMRHGLQVMHGQLQESRQETREEIKGVHEKIGESRQKTRTEFQQVHEKIEESRQEARDDIRRLDARIDETNRRIDSRFAILMTTLIGVAGVIIATIKL